MENKAYPLTWPVGWPRTNGRVRSRFGKGDNTPSVDAATRFLQDEVQRLNGQRTSDRYVNNFILSTNIELRQDGNPYSKQKRFDDPGVAAYFKYKGEDMVIACDTFDRVGCNIYSIAKTIEAMRGIDRWGASELLKRAFSGFKALPQHASQPSWHIILDLPINATADQVQEQFRTLSKKYHPDNLITGDSEKFITVKMAFEDAKKQMQRS